MAERESPELAVLRRAEMAVVREHYTHFLDFLADVMEHLGFELTEVQEDIADFLETGPLYRMVQAQRGQAKTTITAAYAVWRLIQDPSTRVLIFSAGGDLAGDIAFLCVQLIETMDVMAPMRPDKAAGDRTSATDGYDVHHSLRNPDKSASITSVGVTGTVQGKRADVLIADDIESSKNSQTALMRERLLHLTKDFTSINQNGDIIYLGTPQSMDSIYNTLPGRGFVVRIWPGRIPTPEQEERYGTLLAPWIKRLCRMHPEWQSGYGPAGLDGKPIDEIIVPEASLLKKELDQGRSYFMLQHMLITDLADEERFPLKVGQILLDDLSDTHGCTNYIYMPAPQQLIEIPTEHALHNSNLYRAIRNSQELHQYEVITLFVDPAGGGQNGDETAYAVVAFLAGFLYVLEVGGYKGGYSDEVLRKLSRLAIKYKVNQVVLEPNFGYGTVTKLLIPVLREELAKHNEKFKESLAIGAIDGEFVTAQKEQRICDALEPLIGSKRLIMNISILREDVVSTQSYPTDKRKIFQLFSQIKHMTREKGSLLHDDRVDVLHQAARYYAVRLARDAAAEEEKRKAKAEAEWMKNPLGRPMTNKPKRVSPAVARLMRNR